MKLLYCAVILKLLFVSQTLNAQTTAEWLSQKKTQKKYLLAQIAALQTYLGWLKDGYKIVNGGLTTLSKIKNGDINLHTVFFNGLKNVSPSIMRNSKFINLIESQVSLYLYCQNVRRRIMSMKGLAPSNKEVIGRLYSQFIFLTGEDIFSLINLVKSGSVDMNDSDRLKAVNQLYDDFQKRRSFIYRVSSELITHGLTTFYLQSEIANFQKLY
jgi:hypothetical protein